MMKFSEIINLYKEEQVDSFLKSKTGFNLTEKNLNYKKIEKFWKPLGDNMSNASVINMLKNGEKGLIERITNAVDSVIEKKFKDLNLSVVNSSKKVLEKAFPDFYKKISELDTTRKLQTADAKNNVLVVANDGSKSNKITFDIIDNGVGIEGNKFATTILSLNKGNKISSDKQYLIGAFGQGGSTSLPFCSSTIIISKKNNNLFFTVVKCVELTEYKTGVYMYLTDINGNINKLEDDSNFCSVEDYLGIFLNFCSGTIVRMIETDITKQYRINDINKKGALGDYINTNLFNIGLPIKLIENRKDFRDNKSSFDRYYYGAFLRAKTSKLIKKELSGTMEIENKNNIFKVDYYVILPEDESLWGKDSAARESYNNFNVTEDPIIYTVNGQLISSEKFTKIGNAGLSNLKYRLLVVINLDFLGSDKYKFFASTRDAVKNTDLTNGLL